MEDSDDGMNLVPILMDTAREWSVCGHPYRSITGELLELLTKSQLDDIAGPDSVVRVGNCAPLMTGLTMLSVFLKEIE